MTASPRLTWVLVLTTWSGLIASALGVVYAKHESRKAFIEVQALSAERDELDIEWDRLLIEQSTWATHARIERIAREQLSMRVPSPDDVVIVQP